MSPLKLLPSPQSFAEPASSAPMQTECSAFRIGPVRGADNEPERSPSTARWTMLAIVDASDMVPLVIRRDASWR